MFQSPKHPEIDHQTIKLIIGVISISLAILTSLFATTPITSISASYYEFGWSQTIFIGFLFAIAAFLLAYNGQSRNEMILSKVAAGAGLCVALFPCGCDSHIELIPYIHGVAAATMFLILAVFCYIFFQRAKKKGYSQAKKRAIIYTLCGITIILAILILAIDNLLGGFASARIPRLTFYGETAGLVAFGISWLTASRVLPVITREDERFSPFGN